MSVYVGMTTSAGTGGGLHPAWNAGIVGCMPLNHYLNVETGLKDNVISTTPSLWTSGQKQFPPAEEIHALYGGW